MQKDPWPTASHRHILQRWRNHPDVHLWKPDFCFSVRKPCTFAQLLFANKQTKKKYQLLKKRRNGPIIGLTVCSCSSTLSTLHSEAPPHGLQCPIPCPQAAGQSKDSLSICTLHFLTLVSLAIALTWLKYRLVCVHLDHPVDASPSSGSNAKENIPVRPLLHERTESCNGHCILWVGNSKQGEWGKGGHSS